MMPAGSARWVIAHQGGWDEILMFAVPVVLAIMAVRWAERRARDKDRRDDVPTDRDAADEPAQDEPG